MPTVDTTLTEFLVWEGTEAEIQSAVQGGQMGPNDIAFSTDGPEYLTESTVEALDATDSITLADNTIYNGSTQTSLTIALWSTPAVTSIAEVVFTSGTTATTLTYPNTIKWLGDDISANVFTPVASKRYTIIFYYDGVETVGVVKGVV